VDRLPELVLPKSQAREPLTPKAKKNCQYTNLVKGKILDKYFQKVWTYLGYLVRKPNFLGGGVPII
jgi:hypothetical protein